MSKTVQNGYVTATATGSWVKVTEFGDNYGFNHLMVVNGTDGDVELAWEDSAYPDLRIVEGADAILDFILGKSPIYVRFVSGAGGPVYIKAWSSSQ